MEGLHNLPKTTGLSAGEQDLKMSNQAPGHMLPTPE